MVKKRQQPIKQTPIQKVQTRKTRQLTRRLSQETNENHPGSVNVETSQNSQNPNQDIDIYFDSCISQTYVIKSNPQQQPEKNYQHNTLYLNHKLPLIPEVKYEFVQENEVHSESFVEKIVQENEQNQSQNSNYGNQSPIFGLKTDKNQTYTPPYKHEEFKIYEHSQENVGGDLIDQLDDGSKVSIPSEKESIQQQISIENSNNRFCSNLNKRKKKNQALKKQPTNGFLQLEKTQQYQSSKHYHETVPEIRRRAEMLRMSSLMDAKINYDKSLQELNKTCNFLRSVMYYYQVRESHQKLYSFRLNVFQVLSEEIEKLKNALVLKREVCCETIKKKSKKGQAKLWRYQLENSGIF